MKYLSVCSGIEAASVAWHDLGWEPVAFSEIEPFPSAVLAHRFTLVPNLGDMTKFKEWKNVGSIGLLVGGTPCQAFSVAGLRQGLADPRGNLMLTFGAIAGHFKPTWVVWENVPGVLSSNGGRDFGSFLGMLGELGYGVAYRVLDAQYFGVAQRRRRVFVVGYLGDWRRAASVLFESESLCGYLAPSRGSGEGTSTYAKRSTGSGKQVFGTLTAVQGEKQWLGNQEALSGDYHILCPPISPAVNTKSNVLNHAPDTVAYVATVPTIPASLGKGVGHNKDEFIVPVTHTLCREGYNASEDGTDRSTPLVPVAFHPTQDPISSEDVNHAMGTGSKGGQASVAVAFDTYNQTVGEVAQTLKSPAGGVNESIGTVLTAMQVRRLTPRECERLQGFPDDWTLIPRGNKPAEECPDGPRYKAIGNSMAVPVMAWIGDRIQKEIESAALATTGPQQSPDRQTQSTQAGISNS